MGPASIHAAPASSYLYAPRSPTPPTLDDSECPDESLHDEDLQDLDMVSSDGSDVESLQQTDAGGEQNDEDEQKLVLARRETNHVRCLRTIVLLILITAAALCGAYVYLYTSADEAQNFEVVYRQYAQLIVDTVQRNAQHKLEAVGAIASLVQAHAINSNSTWPFVTVPFFEEHVMVSKSLTDAYGVVLFPIVEAENRVAWENYSVQHSGWINASYMAQYEALGADESVLPVDGETWWDVLWGEDFANPHQPDFSSGIGVPIFVTTHADDITNYNPVIETLPGPYYPQWQAASMSIYYQSTINSNYAQFADFLQSTTIATETGNAVIGMPWTDFSAPGYISTLLYPVFDQFHGANRKVSAFLGVDIYWEKYISRILPANATGIHVVIESTFGESFTFVLVGDQAIYLGDGDMHEPAFDDMAVKTKFGEYLQEPISSDTYTGTPLYGGFYQYNLTVYPSEELQDVYLTRKPIVYTVAILSVFLFTSLLFVTYDCMVERRQRLVMTSAVRSDAIVSSLFPSNVKERLYEQQDEETQRNQTCREEDKLVADFLGITNPNSKDGPPIAELYSSATVLFADIAGFTAWSSTRSPVDVFTLLEALYGAFDKKAKRRGVFKIETIGDCYVAVTGLPKPRDDHALVMAKFARSMMQVWEKETQRLSSVLGSELLELGLRVGMHSGSVTAGVLRGDRARFQLFGDTVNTASRIESNGRPMHIHLSSETAHLLRDRHHKGHWIRPRQDKIVAKGKGQMQTWWMSRGTSARSHVSNDSTTFVDELSMEQELLAMERRLLQQKEESDRSLCVSCEFEKPAWADCTADDETRKI